MIDEDFIATLMGKCPKISKRDSLDVLTLECSSTDLLDLARTLLEEDNFDLLVDVTAIDHGEIEDVRFTVVYHFYSLIHKDYIRVHVDCESNTKPSVPSLSTIYPAANWHERETYDMFGISFKGHPDMRRILMWDDYPYFPLRKEFPLAGIETPLPADDVVEVTDASVEPAPMMGGPFVSSGEGEMSNAEPRAKDESWTETMEKPE